MTLSAVSVVNVSSALTLPGTKLLPSHLSTSPTAGAALVVSTSLSESILEFTSSNSIQLPLCAK